jgi:riboflavin kinase/FMN adenylyltransferase
MGRTIGYPTANLQIAEEDKLIPCNGVYVVQVEIPHSKQTDSPTKKRGMMNIGIRPTVDGKNRVIEVHLMDWKGSLYNQVLRVELISFIREEQKFDSLESLRDQIKRDEQVARNFLNVDQ